MQRKSQIVWKLAKIIKRRKLTLHKEVCDDVRYFTKGFIQSGNNSQWYFSKWQFPKGIFPSGTFPRVFSLLATSQMYNFPSGNLQVCPSCSARPLDCSSRSAWPHCSLRRLRRPNLTFGKLLLGKLHIWEVFT